jgi:hypothetical protein
LVVNTLSCYVISRVLLTSFTHIKTPKNTIIRCFRFSSKFIDYFENYLKVFCGFYEAIVEDTNLFNYHLQLLKYEFKAAIINMLWADSSKKLILVGFSNYISKSMGKLGLRFYQ